MNNASHRILASGVGPKAYGWWKSHCAPACDPGVRARLRRCASSSEAAQELAAVDLLRVVGATRAPSDNVGLDLARLLAHVTDDAAPTSLMRLAGRQRYSAPGVGLLDRPLLSESGFHRLLHCRSHAQLLPQLVRILRHCGTSTRDRSVAIGQLAEDFWRWDDPTRQRWALDYYAVRAPSED